MSESLFRITVGVLLVIMGMGRWVFGHHWFRAKKKTIRQETGLVFLYLVFIPGTVCLLLYLFTSWLDPFRVGVPVWIRLVGSAVFLAGDILFVWTHRSLGRNWSPRLEIMENHTLITTGPYRYVRHPLYAAALIIALGLSLVSANWLLALTWTGASIWLFLRRMPAEEAMMIEEFGDEYRDYMKRTGRLIPRIG